VVKVFREVVFRQSVNNRAFLAAPRAVGLELSVYFGDFSEEMLQTI
jgi:hypothetical protein